MNAKNLVRTAGVLATAAVAVLGSQTIAHAQGSTVYVGNGDGGGAACRHSTVHSVQEGVDLVAPGGTVIVCPGTYKESVTISKRITLQGQGAAVVDATGKSYGIAIGADHVTVAGMTVKNAAVGLVTDPSTCGAGPAAPLCAGIVTFASVGGPPVPGNYATISDNVLTGNLGFGVDLVSTHDSVVKNNRSNGNGIGFNVVDDLGLPVKNNKISGNTANGNLNGCGIALASHVGAGVIGNLVQNNTANGNGLPAGGAGILLATPTDGGIVQGNRLEGNHAAGNGHAGVEVHIHVATAKAGGNTIVGNTIGKNNTGGDYKDPDTTGIYLGSNSPMSIVVGNNTISDDVNGVFVAGPHVNAERWGNTFNHVQHPAVSIPDFA